MKKEIRKDVRDYILTNVNESLSRLGVSEKVVETKVNEQMGRLVYLFESAPIRQFPMMFKKLEVYGNLYVEREEEEYTLINVHISYRYDHFEGGRNGCDLGQMIFSVASLPKSFDGKFFNAKDFISKIKGIEI